MAHRSYSINEYERLLSAEGWLIIHDIFGLFSGYYLARLIGMDGTSARAVSIEVGMQNSGLAVALATKHFGALAALPPALFSVWHNLSGSALAWWWRRN